MHTDGGETLMVVVMVKLHTVLTCLCIWCFFTNIFLHFEHVYFIVAGDAPEKVCKDRKTIVIGECIS